MIDERKAVSKEAIAQVLWCSYYLTDAHVTVIYFSYMPLILALYNILLCL